MCVCLFFVFCCSPRVSQSRSGALIEHSFFCSVFGSMYVSHLALFFEASSIFEYDAVTKVVTNSISQFSLFYGAAAKHPYVYQSHVISSELLYLLFLSFVDIVADCELDRLPFRLSTRF